MGGEVVGRDVGGGMWGGVFVSDRVGPGGRVYVPEIDIPAVRDSDKRRLGNATTSASWVAN